MSGALPPHFSWNGLAKAIGWSVAFVVVGAALSVLAFAGAAALGGGSMSGPIGLGQVLVQGLALLVGGLGATWLIGWRGARLGPDRLRWRGTGGGLAGAGRGLALGALIAALAMMAAVPVGGARWLGDEGSGIAFLVEATGLLLALAPAALSEEVIFRGVPLVLLAAVLGRGWAVVLTSAAFALAHLWNPGATLLGVANIGLAGVFLGAMFYTPGGLWTAFGAHLGWNVALAALGAAVSGFPFDIPWLDYAPGGPDWLTGGGFGPEGGLIATTALAGGVAIALGWARRSA